MTTRRLLLQSMAVLALAGVSLVRPAPAVAATDSMFCGYCIVVDECPDQGTLDAWCYGLCGTWSISGCYFGQDCHLTEQEVACA